MPELDCEESWEQKNWCFWTVVLEKTLESPLDCKEIQPVHSNGDQSWVFFERTDAKAETPIIWLPHVKSWLTGKDPVAGRDWGQEEKGTTEDEMAGWHHQLDGQEFGWALGVGDGQGGLACCDSWGHRVRHDWATELNWTWCIMSKARCWGRPAPWFRLPCGMLALTSPRDGLATLSAVITSGCALSNTHSQILDTDTTISPKPFPSRVTNAPSPETPPFHHSRNTSVITYFEISPHLKEPQFARFLSSVISRVTLSVKFQT